jgi:hypothetical protein
MQGVEESRCVETTARARGDLGVVKSDEGLPLVAGKLSSAAGNCSRRRQPKE